MTASGWLDGRPATPPDNLQRDLDQFPSFWTLERGHPGYP